MRARPQPRLSAWGPRRRHLVRAEWRVSELDDYDAFSYYCAPCKEAFAKRLGASEYRFEIVGDETGDEEAETDA